MGLTTWTLNLALAVKYHGHVIHSCSQIQRWSSSIHLPRDLAGNAGITKNPDPSTEVGWNDDGQPSYLPRDERLSHAGSWCHLAPQESIEVHDPFDDEKDILAEDWIPMTPRDSRLSTPDLTPLCTDFEFCSCHPHGLGEEDKINEDFYFVSRSKMDMQLINAQAHMAQTRSGSRSMVFRDE
ncbi:hypothetical protein N0V84_001123 [Fusarium piperis]|uniref:Uncharacterized protein n=1 Tax=Fusarium piperis TaxID=1435070 RepID=A0A9W8WMK5_9HYPO|nr:hypothetical protein N0V84_001123 [Fusarium piperis]